MYNEIKDFNGKIFENLLNGFRCKCIIDGMHSFVIFEDDLGNEKMSFTGNEANDILDYVLSVFYGADDVSIEEGFNRWLASHLSDTSNAPSLPFDNVSILDRYNGLCKEWEKLDKLVRKLSYIIKRKNRYIKKLESKVRRLSKELSKSKELE